MTDEERFRASDEQPARPPLQFGIRTLLGITVAVAVLFAVLRWLEVPPKASAMVLVILAVSVVAAVGLIAAIAHDRGDDD